jgi:hypothetical protein
MKIISLNTWGGRAGKEGLLAFFSEHKKDTDIFCLQEIWSAPYSHLEGYKAGGKEIDHSEIMVHGLQEITELLSDFVPCAGLVRFERRCALYDFERTSKEA